MQTLDQKPVGNTVVEPTEQTKPDFGSGRYSALMEEVYNDAQTVLGLEPAKAEKLARQVGSDFGAFMRTAQVDARVGKSINSNGKVTISEAAKVKGVTCTNSLFAMRAIQWSYDAGKFGFSWKNSTFKPVGQLKDYLDNL